MSDAVFSKAKIYPSKTTNNIVGNVVEVKSVDSFAVLQSVTNSRTSVVNVQPFMKTNTGKTVPRCQEAGDYGI
jgi:hypothetical protein